MSRPPFEKPKRFFTWKRKVYWTYRMLYTQYQNPHFDNEEWHCWEEWAVFVGWKQPDWKWFGYEDFRYDGQTCQLVTFCGIVFGKYYGYDARPVKEEE